MRFCFSYTSSSRKRSGSKRVVCFELHHRPDNNASSGEDVFEKWELCQQVGLYAFAGLVSCPKSVAKRLNNMIGGNRDVCGALNSNGSFGKELTAPCNP